MKYCDYETLGIHSRLKNIITKCGGYDKYESAKILVKNYSNLDFDVALEMCKTPDIWDRLKTNGLELETQRAKKKLRDREVQFASVFATLSSMSRRSGVQHSPVLKELF